jgi:protein-L-isoaspartate(D-aspartate) O-methyltransferase
LNEEPPMIDESLSKRRRWMVDDQLRRRGIRDERVLSAMARVPRHEFVPEYLQPRAYEDGALPIDFGQTISQPYTVAFMCEAAELRGNEKVLEVGGGSGYAAAVLAELAASVYSLERIEPLANDARERLKRLGYENVTVICADGTLGYAEAAPYDAILVAAGADTLPPTFRRQLADGGRIVIPITESHGSQTMHRFRKRGDQLADEELGAFAFVPLIADAGRDPTADVSTDEPGTFFP